MPFTTGHTLGFRKGYTPWNKGLSLSEETKLKISLTLKGIKRNPNRTSFKKGHKTSLETRNKISENCKGIHLGNKHPNWRGGISFEPYSVEFNKILKEQIRKRDNYRCQECFRHQDELYDKNDRKYSLFVHHIDYNKRNNNPSNLISLCGNCHSQTNFSREDWNKYYQRRIQA